MSFEQFLKDCPPDRESETTGEKTAFTVSENVLEKLDKVHEPSPSKEGAQKPTTMWKEIAANEKTWRDIEKQVDEAHDIKVGTDISSLINLENRIKKYTTKCPCAAGFPVVECIDKNIEMPLQCHHLVKDYLRCVAKYTQNFVTKIAQES